MTLSSGDVQSYALEPGVTSICSAFRQLLKVPITLSKDWYVCLHTLIYTHSFGNTLLDTEDGFHASAKGGLLHTVWEVTLSPYRNYHSVKDVVKGLVSQFDVFSLPALSVYGQVHMESPSTHIPSFPDDPKVNYFTRDLVDAWLAKHPTLPYVGSVSLAITSTSHLGQRDAWRDSISRALQQRQSHRCRVITRRHLHQRGRGGARYETNKFGSSGWLYRRVRLGVER